MSDGTNDSAIEWAVKIQTEGRGPSYPIIQYAQGDTRDEAIENAKQRHDGPIKRIQSAQRLGPTEEVDFL